MKSNPRTSLSERWRYWRPRYSGLARLRAFWHIVVRDYCCEVCQRCGRRVSLVWWCPDDALWLTVNGREGGLMCVPCFDRRCRQQGAVQRWVAKPL